MIDNDKILRLGSKPPTNISTFNERISDISSILGVPEKRTRRLIGAIIFAQMLPDNAFIKGGIGIKLRLGEIGTRATSDLDMAYRGNNIPHLEHWNSILSRGWGKIPPSKQQLKKDSQAQPRVAFSARLVEETARIPQGVPDEYVMVPYSAKIYFLNEKQPFISLRVEVGRDEMNISEKLEPQKVLSLQAETIALALGVGEVQEIHVISTEYQIAQKIHALVHSEDRGHDLVDLQLLWNQSGQPLDEKILLDTCKKVFSYRKSKWPPITDEISNLDKSYRNALEEAEAGAGSLEDVIGKPLVLLPSIESAKIWLDEKIEQISKN